MFVEVVAAVERTTAASASAAASKCSTSGEGNFRLVRNRKRKPLDAADAVVEECCGDWAVKGRLLAGPCSGFSSTLDRFGDCLKNIQLANTQFRGKARKNWNNKEIILGH